MKQVKDHLGKTYYSIKDMCEAYGIKENTYYVRQKRGWTLEQTLTSKKTRVYPVRNKYVDEQGNQYSSLQAMCDAHNVNVTTYHNRKQKGLPQNECLKSTKVKDHLGNVYNTVKELCATYNVSTYKYYYGKKKGHSIEKILNVDKNK